MVVEGDNANVMGSISSTGVNQSRLGHIIEDIQSLALGLRWMNVSHVKWGANTVAILWLGMLGILLKICSGWRTLSFTSLGRLYHDFLSLY